MKHSFTKLIFLGICMFILNAFHSKAQNIQADNAYSLAVQKSKPVITLLYSDKCYSSRYFSRKVMQSPTVNQLFHSKFIYTQVDANTAEGKKLARQNKILILPALIMESNDKSIHFLCKLSLDTNQIMEQVKSFLISCNIKEQIELYKSASKASLREASQKIAKYYASRDKKKSQDPLREVYNYTLHIKFFKEFEDAYIEYAKLEENS